MDMNIIKLSVHTDQEAYDAAIRHLKGMPRRAAAPLYNSACVYETEDGKSNCVVGALLVLDTPEKHSWARNIRASIKNLLTGADTGWDPQSGVDERDRFRIDQNGINPDLLAYLQSIHDSTLSWNTAGFIGWNRVREVATPYGLNTKVLDALDV